MPNSAGGATECSPARERGVRETCGTRRPTGPKDLTSQSFAPSGLLLPMYVQDPALTRWATLFRASGAVELL